MTDVTVTSPSRPATSSYTVPRPTSSSSPIDGRRASRGQPSRGSIVRRWVVSAQAWSVVTGRSCSDVRPCRSRCVTDRTTSPVRHVCFEYDAFRWALRETRRGNSSADWLAPYRQLYKSSAVTELSRMRYATLSWDYVLLFNSNNKCNNYCLVKMQA